MTILEARAVAQKYQERCDALGPRTGEGDRLAECVNVIADLCNQLEALSPAPQTGVELPNLDADV